MSLKKKKAAFVMQKHAAKKAGLHYDFRLEMPVKSGGKHMLISWVIKKGPSLDPLIKRLAIETNPHDMKYGDFEGIIETSQFGAGKTIIWDAGTYEIIKPEIKSKADLKQVKMFEFRLHGKKLKGIFIMVKTKRGWLFKKKKDLHADASIDIVKDAPRSIISGKSIEEVTKEDGYISKVTKGLGL